MGLAVPVLIDAATDGQPEKFSNALSAAIPGHSASSPHLTPTPSDGAALLDITLPTATDIAGQSVATPTAPPIYATSVTKGELLAAKATPATGIVVQQTDTPAPSTQTPTATPAHEHTIALVRGSTATPLVKTPPEATATSRPVTTALTASASPHSVARGSTVSITVRGRPKSVVTVTVYLPSVASVTYRGLTGANGSVTIQVQVPHSVGTGIAPVAVAIGEQETTTSFTVV